MIFTVSEDLDANSINGNLEQFVLTVNGEEVPITHIGMSELGQRSIELTTGRQLLYSNVIKLSYSGSYIKSQNNDILGAFSDLEIRNTLPLTFALPTTIQAEDFLVNQGFGVDNISEGSDNKYIGWTDAGDYADYEVYADQASNWEVKFNITANWDGELGLYLVYEDGTETELTTLEVANTGGWFSYQTISANISLPQGYSIIRLKAISDGFNVDWMEFIFISANNDDDLDKDGILNENDDCPNTPEGAVVDANGCEVFSLPADNFEIVATAEACKGEANGMITVTAKDDTIDYRISVNGLNPQSFSTSISFSNLAVGEYELRITVDGEDYEQQFVVKVNEGTELQAKSSITSKKATVEIFQGTAPFEVFINGQQMLSTYSNVFTVDVKHGDLLMVKSSKSCEGVLTKPIEMFEAITAFPNPTLGAFEIAIPGSRTEVKVDLFNTQMQLISSKKYRIFNNKISVSLENKPPGVYMAVVHMEKSVTLKIIKQ